MAEGCKSYLFEYEHDGATWGIEIKAHNDADARARLRVIPFAVARGVVIATIPVSESFLSEECYHQAPLSRTIKHMWVTDGRRHLLLDDGAVDVVPMDAVMGIDPAFGSTETVNRSAAMFVGTHSLSEKVYCFEDPPCYSLAALRKVGLKCCLKLLGYTSLENLPKSVLDFLLDQVFPSECEVNCDTPGLDRAVVNLMKTFPNSSG